ncbi:MAG: hypothetical protein EOP37_08320 [Rubrivivax sp.]|nr:MAG: hypothetical protein EOP37_08320 [Rubrivivax sp.]
MSFDHRLNLSRSPFSRKPAPPPRAGRPAGCVLALVGLGLGLANVAMAQQEGTPPWALGDHRCAYTLISPRVALTTMRCGVVAMHPEDGPALVFRQRSTGLQREGTVAISRRPLAVLPPAGLALVRFKGGNPFNTDGAPLASYQDEAALLRDPVDATSPRGAGTRLFGHVDVERGSYGVATRTTYVFGTDRRLFSDEHPLVYRSLAHLKKHEPSRFLKREKSTQPLDWDDLLGDRVRASLRGRTAAEHDDLLVALPGKAADGLTHRRREAHRVHPAFATFEAGTGLIAMNPVEQGGLEANREKWATAERDRIDRLHRWTRSNEHLAALEAFGKEHRARTASDHAHWSNGRLVAIVSGETPLHLRLSAHWPLIYRMLLAEGLKDDARHVARQVLPLNEFASDRRGTPGAFYGMENPSTAAFEFYRLRRVDADGTYPAVPAHGQGDHWWEFLGIELPSRHKVLDQGAGSEALPVAEARGVNPLPGTGPVLPAPAAAR